MVYAKWCFWLWSATQQQYGMVEEGPSTKPKQGRPGRVLLPQRGFGHRGTKLKGIFQEWQVQPHPVSLDQLLEVSIDRYCRGPQGWGYGIIPVAWAPCLPTRESMFMRMVKVPLAISAEIIPPWSGAYFLNILLRASALS